MNTRTTMLLVALLALPFSVQASDTVKQLSDHTGLSERQVQMVIGPRTAYPEYRASYQRSVAKFRASLGEENYRRAMNGESFVLERRGVPDDADKATADAMPPTPSRQERVTGS